jgi:hypothetical protein
VLCNRCLKELTPGGGEFFVVRVEAVADPTPPVIGPEDLDRDVGREINDLFGRLAGLSEQEANDQVYRKLIFHLCNVCFREWIEDPCGPYTDQK